MEKARSLESLSFEGYAPGQAPLEEYGTRSLDARRFYAWYQSYVSEKYLGVPGDISELTDMVNQIEQSAACRAWQEVLEQGETAARNLARLQLGNLVAGELQSRARYDMDPGSLPGGMDPVAFFWERTGGDIVCISPLQAHCFCAAWEYPPVWCPAMWCSPVSSGRPRRVTAPV